MSLAILEITDGTTAGTVSLLDGPVYLKDWNPSGGEYKGGGVFSDSPVQDYRFIVAKSKANIAERFDVSVMDASEQVTATLDQLTLLLEDASTYWATKRRAGRRVWIKAQARSESLPRYADIITGRIPSLKNPYAQPHIQSDGECSTDMLVLQDSIQILVERTDWYGSAPGDTDDLEMSRIDYYDNLMEFGEMDPGTGGRYHWVREANGEIYFLEDTDSGTRGNYFMRVENTSGTNVGAYQQVDNLTASTNYVITWSARVNSGGGRAIFKSEVDGLLGGTGSPTSIVNGTWTTQSVTVPASSNGTIRVYFEATAATDEIDIDWVHMRYSNDGNTTSRRPVGLNRTGLVSEDIVGNRNSNDNITHIFYYDDSATTWYGNQIPTDGGGPVELIPSAVTPAANDIIWFGSESNSTTTKIWNSRGGQFDSLVLPIEQPAVPAGAENFTNPTFDAGITSWSFFSTGGGDYGHYDLKHDTTVKRTGAGSMQLMHWNETGNFQTQCAENAITFDENEPYHLGFWVRPVPSSVNASENSKIDLQIIFYNSGSPVFHNTGWITLKSLWGDQPYTDPEWKYISMEGVSPAGTTTCDAGFQFKMECLCVPYWDTRQFINIDDATFVSTDLTYVGEWVDQGGTAIESEGFKDGSDLLRNAGTQAVSFPEESLTRTTKDGVTAYWIGYKMTTVPAGLVKPTLSMAAFKPYKNFVEVPAAYLEGDGPTDLTIKFRELSAPTSATVKFEDVKFDAVTVSGTPDTTSAIYTQDDADTVGVCFQNVTVPINAYIKSAWLNVSPAGTNYTLTKALNLDLYVQEPAFAGGITQWTADSQMGPTGTDVLSDVMYHWEPNLSQWDLFDGVAVSQSSQAVRMNVTELFQAVVDGSRWGYNEDIAFHIHNQISSGTGTLDWHTSNATTEQPVWSLDVEYASTGINLRRVFVGSRSTERGPLFKSHIPLSKVWQPYIEIIGRESWSNDVVFGAPDTNTATKPARFMSLIIHQPMSQDYSGRFRVFLSGDFDHEVVVWLKYRAGKQSKLLSSDKVTSIDPGTSPTLHQATLDMGEIYIDPNLQPNIVEIQVWADSWSGNMNIHDIYIMPSDEWFGEFNIEGEDPGVGLFDDLELRIDGVSYPFTRPRAFLSEISTGNEVANVRSSATQLQLYPGKTQRLYFLTQHLKTPEDSWDHEQSLYTWPHTIAGVTLEKRTRYSSFR